MFTKLTKSILLIFTLTLGLPAVSQATCDLLGYGVRVVSFTGITVLYFRPTHLAPYFYVGHTTDPIVSDAMYNGYKGKAKLFVRGSAATCPNIVGNGQFNIGQITAVGLGL